jgi:Protein of unknown function (DUF3987)
MAIPPPIATGGAAVNSAVAELASIPHWVCWKSQMRGGKPTKVPFTPAGSKASSTDPATWSSFNECWTAAFVDGRFDGVGFVFCDADGLVGLDFDDCIKDDVIDTSVLDVVSRLGTYAEISPSGTGIKAFVGGKLPEPGRRNGKLEVYQSKRFFTVTGRHVSSSPDRIVVSQSALDEIWATHFAKPRAKASQQTGKLPPYPDQAAIDVLLQDQTAAAYWGQKYTVCPQDDQSPSAWDLAFAGYLARQGQARETIAGFLGAYRKHHESHKGKQDRAAYVWSTVDQALGDQDEDEFTSDAERKAGSWSAPDLTVLSPRVLPAPALPLDVFGPFWSGWLAAQAEIKACPADYVAAGLLSSAGILLGNARWGSPWPGWAEPPIIWALSVGTPSTNKSPGQDATFIEVLRELERESNANLDERMREWREKRLLADLARKKWQEECMAAMKGHKPTPPLPPQAEEPDEPDPKRILTNEGTVEKLARVVGGNPKGLLLTRDELAGWLGAMDKYGGVGSDRAFFIEAYGGRPYTIDRMRDKQPVIVRALTIGIAGGIQPDRLNSSILSQDDDGLAARFLYFWPERVPPSRPKCTVDDTAKRKLGRLHGLQCGTSGGGAQSALLFIEPAAVALHEFRCQAAELETAASGFFLSWLGKLPGFAVRLATIFEHLYWCGDQADGVPSPTRISEKALVGAVAFLSDYSIPMARRCFGEAALPKPEKDAATLARWIARQAPVPKVLNARDIQRLRLAGLSTRDDVHEALVELEQAGWVRQILAQTGWQRKGRRDWEVSPKLIEALS